MKSVCIRSFSGQYLSVFSPNAGKDGPEKFRIRTLFTQCKVFLKALPFKSIFGRITMITVSDGHVTIRYPDFRTKYCFSLLNEVGGNKFKKHLKKNFKVIFFKVRIAIYFCFHALAWAYLRKLYWNSMYWVFSYSSANCARCVCKMWLVLTKRKNFPLLWEQGCLTTSLVFGGIKLRLRG